jgi:drug/metabolite transporter (DMT)-like permease
MRFAIAATLLFAVAALMGVRLGGSRKERVIWLGNGLLSFTITYGVVYWSEQWVPSGLAAVLFATYPLAVAIIAHFALHGERLSAGELFGVVIGLGGVGVIFSEDLAALGGREVYVAALVMLLSPLSAAFGTVVVKRWGTDIHPFSLAAGPMVVTAGVMAAIALWLERGQEFTWNTESIGALLYLSIFGSAVTFFLYYWLLTLLPAKRLALTAYIIPLIAVSVGVLRGEPLHQRILLGAGLVVAGVALAVHRSSSQAQ